MTKNLVGYGYNKSRVELGISGLDSMDNFSAKMSNRDKLVSRYRVIMV